MTRNRSTGCVRHRDDPPTRVLGAFVLIPAVAVGAVTACSGLGPSTRGEGPVRTESRQANAFSRIDVTTGIPVVVRTGSRAPLVEVTAQESILPIIATDVEGSTLRIRPTTAFNTNDSLGVSITVPKLEGITLSGGSRADLQNVAADVLDLQISGGAAVTASGTSDTVSLTASGGSRADLDELAAKTVLLDVSGGSNVTVRASGEVRGSTSGAGRARVVGGPRVDVATSSGGTVDAR